MDRMIGICGLDRSFSAKWLNPVVLRVATNLARLWQSQGMTVEACEFSRLPRKRCVLGGRCGKQFTQILVQMGDRFATRLGLDAEALVRAHRQYVGALAHPAQKTGGA